MSLRESLGLPPSVALHRYWMYANRMRDHFEAAIKKNPPRQQKDDKSTMKEAFLFMADERGMFMAYWYGGLYVVIEGWKQLSLSDPDIDPLLASPNVRLLKEFRNGAFHFQKKYIDNRFADFMRSTDSVPWVHELTSAFGAYFLRIHAKDSSQET
jgi:hypothetical protein